MCNIYSVHISGVWQIVCIPAPELLDPKAKDEGKDSDKSSSPFPWLPKEFRYSFSSSSPPPPVQATQQNGSPVNTPSTGVPSGIQSYAKSQQKQNNTAISKATQR